MEKWINNSASYIRDPKNLEHSLGGSLYTDRFQNYMINTNTFILIFASERCIAGTLLMVKNKIK